MGFFARPDLSDVQFKQSNDSILTLSGQTRIISPSGLTLMGQSGYVPIDISTNNINNYTLTYDSGVIRLKAPSASGDTTAAANIGTGIGIYSSLSGTTLLFKTLIGSGNTSISQVGNNIIIYSSGASVATGINVGSGIGVYDSSSGSTLQFNTLVGSGNTSISQVGNDVIIYSSGGTASGERVTKKIYQPSHGFSIGNVLGWSGGTYNKAIADGSYDGEVLGIVNDIIDVDNFYITQTGFVSGLTGLNVNSTYFLSDVIPGGLSLNSPAANGHISKAVLIAVSPTNAWVLSYPGFTVITGGTSSGGTTGGSGERVTKRIYQPSHGFSVSNVIGWSGGSYNKAIANGNYNGEVLGIVNNVVDIDYFDLTQTGFVSGLTGLNVNSTYFLSDSVAGDMMLNPTTTNGHISKAVLIAVSPSSAWVLSYPGFTVITGGTSSGSSTYNLSSPSTCTVGGILSGTNLIGKTAFQLFEELLVPELFGTVSVPSISINLSASGIREIGCALSQTVTGCFNRGSINPQYCSVSPYRSGAANAYSFTGSGMPVGFQSCTSSSASNVNSTYNVVSGVQSWGVCASYDAGSPALGSNGTQYCAALVAGCSNTASGSITGILPWYWGKSATGVVTGTDVANGTKTIASVGSSTPITFNATTEYLWFAAPQGTYTPKTKWWVCAPNAGNIGGVGELWAAACSVSVTSGQGCWSGCSFDVYVTCGITSTPTGVVMCLYY